MPEKQELSVEEKIEYIYSYILKEEKRARVKKIIKGVFWLVIIVYFYIAIFVMLPKMLGGIIPGFDMSKVKETIFGSKKVQIEEIIHDSKADMMIKDYLNNKK